MAHGEPINDESLQQAFEAAKSENFKLMFSFDYAGRGPWPKETVINLLKNYASQAEYFKHSDGKPLVSTFEGPGNAGDWKDIKKQVGCFFIPDWSSKGARPALELADRVADGLFNWAAWPWGANDMDTYVDASYFQYLKPDGSGGKPYMMPVSPWFYTNMPGFKKNWLWRGDDLWHDRWIQVVYNQPESAAEVSVMVGSKAQEGKWTSVPDGGIGVYHGSVPFTGTSAVSIRIQRSGQTLAQIDGASINNNCQDDLTKWNPWVGSASLSSSVSATPALARKDQKCIKGTSAKGFAELCEFNCKYGYCPVSSCLCQALGKPIPEPKALEVDGFPAKGKSENYSGLCSWAYDKCQETDATFSREEMRAGSHYDVPMIDPTTPSASNNQYITIVNMTPYRFKYLKDQSNFYQMRGDFGDIPPGHSRQCVIEYAVSGTSRVDDKGEAYYEVVGTSHRFNIKARTHFPNKYNLRTVVDLRGWGLGMREYEDPDTEVSLSFVITGSETYGYHHSLSFENTQDA
ncbi:Mutanase [Colletotrichum sp. SAR 10_70]|nr:Mutanase [Colletotrichum sp. SAR 10_71]KAI8188867.1 Mutanase [Colletotrichum sp. SAR 10_70]